MSKTTPLWNKLNKFAGDVIKLTRSRGTAIAPRTKQKLTSLIYETEKLLDMNTMNAEKRELYRILRGGLEAAELESNWHCEDYGSMFSYEKLERAAIALRTLESMEPPNNIYNALNDALAQGISIELKFNPFCESPPLLLCIIAYTVTKVTNKQLTRCTFLLMDESPSEDSIAWAINNVAQELRWNRESDAIREWAGLFHIPMRPGETLENLREWRYQDMQIEVCRVFEGMLHILAKAPNG